MAMSQMGGKIPQRNSMPDIYSVLILIAAVGLLIAVVFVAIKNMSLTGGSNPFAVLGAALPAVPFSSIVP
jgi:hypothetical protein